MSTGIHTTISFYGETDHKLCTFEGQIYKSITFSGDNDLNGDRHSIFKIEKNPSEGHPREVLLF